MTIIPFIEARFFDPKEDRFSLEDRFIRYLRNVRRKKMPPERLVHFEGGDDVDSSSDAGILPSISLSDVDETRIRRRAERIIERRKSTSGLEHLKKEDRARLELLKAGVSVISIPNEHRADELAAALHEDMPWMAPATDVVWRAMRRSVQEGWPGLEIPPLLLNDPPGIGKSRWARRLGELLSVPTTVIEATTENASFGLVGSQRGWGSAFPGRLIETVLQGRIANPVIVIDEVEKAGQAISTKDHIFGLAEALLPLLEPLTSEHWSCPYYQVKFNMSYVAWVLTSNTCDLLPAPLLSRCPPIRLRHLTRAELTQFVRREGMRRVLSDIAIETIAEVLAHPSVLGHNPSLRLAARMLQRAADFERAPLLH
ncbi:MAG: AAA family ATPase [Cypionkella sp.]|uniref:AAA family ATPase n=1 Tax=Cypionkella sp. TaxID=2811411 RepID=UPI002ABA2644|nr:AAA family ATPase [Cypionkella sp.]MDZ4312092.1 AAA family ATPase [Cypionkella sp.]